jgi:hypothetical protein
MALTYLSVGNETILIIVNVIEIVRRGVLQASRNDLHQHTQLIDLGITDLNCFQLRVATSESQRERERERTISGWVQVGISMLLLCAYSIQECFSQWNDLLGDFKILMCQKTEHLLVNAIEQFDCSSIQCCIALSSRETRNQLLAN